MKLSDHHETDSVDYYLSMEGPQFPLSKNFRLVEFASKDGADRVLVHPALIDGLERLRSALGHPLTVTSGYRTPEHNRAIGGATASFHMRGMAADVSSKRVPPSTIAAEARRLGFGGVKAYPTFVHVDVGPKRTW